MNSDKPSEIDFIFMEKALVAARKAVGWGDVPIGAVVSWGDEVLAVTGNERVKCGDPTAHAEILALRQAAEIKESWQLDNMQLTVTLEPCLMCAGALINARIARVVYGAQDPKAGAVGSLYNICADPRLNHELEILNGVCEEESAALLQEFFESRRNQEAE